MTEAVRLSSGAYTLLIGVLSLIWGSTWVTIAVGLEDLPPFLAAGLRFAIASLILAALVWRFGSREAGTSPPFTYSAVMGLCQFSVSYGIVYWCETRLASGLVAVLWGTYPLMIAVAGHFFLPGERMSWLQTLGLLVGFGGVTQLYASDQVQLSRDPIAALILLGSPAVVTVGTVVIKRAGSGFRSLELNRNGMAMGAALLLLASAVTERHLPATFSPRSIGTLLYLAAFGSVAAFGIYFWLLRYDKATRLSVVAYLTPVVALVLGSWVRSEPISQATVVGGSMILVGVWLSKQRPSAG